MVPVHRLPQPALAVQSINGATPSPSGVLPSGAACIQAALDFTGLHYGHNFFVDATPGTGDLYYSGAWHTWLVSGLGAGGAAIFALDVTNPTSPISAKAMRPIWSWANGPLPISAASG